MQNSFLRLDEMENLIVESNEMLGNRHIVRCNRVESVVLERVSNDIFNTCGIIS